MSAVRELKTLQELDHPNVIRVNQLSCIVLPLASESDGSLTRLDSVADS
jgi:hypothetical protein